MNRLITLTVVFVFACPVLFAQKDKDIPAFGKVEVDDLMLKECAFDKNAEAMVLFNVAEVHCSLFINSINSSLNSEIERHVRIKILNDKGLGQADVKIPYYSFKNAMQIKNLTAQTYNIDASGNVTVAKLDKKAVFVKKVSTRYSQMIFTMPEVKPGSVIEFKYTVTGTGILGLDDWHFQKNIPVALSRYSLDFPEAIEVNCQRRTSREVITKRHKNGSRDLQSFTMKNIPALRDEPYISCDEDYVEKLQSEIVAFNGPERRESFVRTWPQVIKTLMEHENFGVQLKKNIPRTKDLDEKLKAVTDPYSRMCIIHTYVRNNMEWDGNNEIWAETGVKSAWSSKKGTSGEINMILVNLLKDADLNAHPILVSTRENGRVNTTSADIDQFNKVLAHVIIDNKIYVLDGTDKFTPSRLIPHDVMYSEGLVIEKLDTYQWGWTTLWDEKQLKKDVIFTAASITEDGTLQGEATISSFDYSRVEKMQKIRSSKSEFLKSEYVSFHPDMEADSMLLKNESNDSMPLVQVIPFKQKINASGDYRYFSANLFSGLEKNPFVAEQRASDIFFTSNQTYTIVGLYTIPEGYEFDELPKNIRMMMPDTSSIMTRQSASQNNRLSVRINLEFKKPFVAVDEYAQFQEFYKKMFGLLNEQYVIRKKTTP